MAATESQYPPTFEEALEQAVDLGAEGIAAKYGDDWFREIDLDILDLADGGVCILGQLENRRHPWRRNKSAAYLAGEKKLGWDKYISIPAGPSSNLAAQRGVNVGYIPYNGRDECGDQKSRYTTYTQLNAAWRHKIASLLAAGALEV